MDAMRAFLQRDTENNIYMIQPNLYANRTNKCRLKKATFSLKQTSIQWNKKLDGGLQKTGLKRFKVDPCVHYNIKYQRIIFIAV